VPLSTPFYMFGTCVRCPSISEVFGMLSGHLQRIGRVWNACTLFPWSQKRLGRLDAVPILSDAFGTLGRRSHPLWDACTPSTTFGRVWKACTLFPASQTRLGRLHAVLERFHVVPNVSDAFLTVSRRLQRLRRIWNACMLSTTFLRFWNAFTLFPASYIRLGCLHGVYSVSYAIGTPTHSPQRLTRFWNTVTSSYISLL
jgi:hypothetical protein